MFGNLPVELLREIVGHIHRPSHLQTLCLVSKAMSSIATQFLYRDLVLDHASDKYAQEEMLDVVKSDGLRFVKTLRVGPMMPILVAPFNHVIAKLQDHSLINFEWDSFLPPLDSQLAYIWDHQWNIQSIDLGEMSLSDAFKAICPRKSLKFPQKFVHMSLSWPHEEDLLEKFDLSVMRELTVRGNLWDNLPSCVSANLANLQLHWTSLFGSKLELDQFTSLLSLGLYRCRGAGSILSKFKNPKLKKFWYEPDWKPEDETDLEEPYAFLRKFQGLETLVIQVPAQRCPANCLKNLTDSISFEHNGTLRSVTFLGACNPKDGDSYANDSRSVLNAVIACTHLIQLELPTEWRTKETDFKQIVDNLPSLKILSLWLAFPLELYYSGREAIICHSAASLIRSITDNPSNLRLLTFQIRGDNLHSRLCFLRNWLHSTHLSDQSGQICEDLVKYYVPEYELMHMPLEI